MRKIFVGTIVLLLTFVIPACGDDPGDQSDDLQESSQEEKADADLDYMKSQLDLFRKQPDFNAPGPAFDAKKEMEGKKILSIPDSSANPFMKDLITIMEDIADEIGFEFIEWENQGQPEEWGRGIEHAININADLIALLGGTEPSMVSPQVEAAQDAGIEVIASHGFEETPSELNYNVAAPFTQAGRLLADWACVESGGEPNVLVLTSNEASATGWLVEGLEDEFETYCPSANVKYVDIPIPEWSSKIQTSVQSALVEDPSIDYILPIYDSMAEFAVAGIEMAGLTGEVKVASFNGTPHILEMVKDGKVEMIIGESVDLIARATLDAEMRYLAGMDFPEEPNIPLYIWTSNNVDQAFETSPIGGFGEQFVEEYEKLWGIAE